MNDGLILLASEPIVDSEGRPTLTFERKWQELITRLVVAESLLADLPNQYVAKATESTWGAWTGTAVRSSKPVYNAVTISNPPTQAQVQAISNALQDATRALKASLDDDIASGIKA